MSVADRIAKLDVEWRTSDDAIGQAATMPGGGSVTEHARHSILRGRTRARMTRGATPKTFRRTKLTSRNGKLWRDGANENRKDEAHTGQREREVGCSRRCKSVNVAAG